MLSRVARSALIETWDLLCIYLAVELQGLCFGSLCVIGRAGNGATEAALKYLFLSAVASTRVLTGTARRYGQTGCTNLLL